MFAVAAGIVALVAPVAASGAPVEAVGVREPIREMGLCEAVDHPDPSVVLCTHGPDPHPDNEHGAASRFPPLTEANSAAPASALPCYGGGQAGHRVQAVYARPADRPDRFQETLPGIRRWATELDHVISASARATGGVRHVRYVTTPDCHLDVMNVTVSPAGDDSFTATVAELRAQGMTRPDRKYLVWMDSDVLCGEANYYLDSSGTRDNANNGPANLPGTIARVDRPCWGLGFRGQSLEAHELVHSLGAVQPTAPHATLRGHCTDDADRMCYSDGSPGAVVRQVCPVEQEALLDCGDDDYLHTNPPAGSYLATSWNIARSSFLATFEPPPPPPSVVTRLAGADRIATSIVSSRDAFPTGGSAGAAVLANAGSFPDALAGVPLAVRRNGPLLLTPASALDQRVLDEIRRVLPAGKAVYLLGGSAALSEGVADSVRAAGFDVVRLAGRNRFETAVAIAETGLNTSSVALEASGRSFADALAAGAAAAAVQGAVLLTDGSTQAPETASYLLRHPTIRRFAIGGPAAAADPTAERVVGADRYETAVAVARRFFPQPTLVGVANGLTFPDALAGGANIGSRLGPVLLTTPNAPVPAALFDYLQTLGTFEKAIVYGGTASVGDDVVASLNRAAAPPPAE